MVFTSVCLFALTWGRDAVFPFRRACQLDHLHYRSLWREIPLVDVMPLSFRTHQIVTGLRDSGLRLSTNFALRCAGLIWLSVDGFVIASVGLIGTGHAWLIPEGFHAIVTLPATAFTIVTSMATEIVRS